MNLHPILVFAYGTLRPGLGNRPVAKDFLKIATRLGPATFQGKLYSVDWYPGMIASDDPTDIVLGDLFKVDPTPTFFDTLDTYEMCSPAHPMPHEYIRVVQNVLWQGRETPAWVYLYTRVPDGLTQITTGDFADHVNSSPSS